MKANRIHCMIGGYTVKPTGRSINNYDVILNTLLPAYPGTGIEDKYVNHMTSSTNRTVDGWINGLNTNEAIDERAIYKTVNTGVNYTSDAKSTVYSYITNDTAGESKDAGTIVNKLYMLEGIDASTTSLVLNGDTVLLSNLNGLTASLTKIVTLKLSDHLLELNGPSDSYYPYTSVVNNNTLVTLDASGYSLNTTLLASTALKTVIANNLKSNKTLYEAPATITTFTSNNVWDEKLPIVGSKTKTNVCTMDLSGSTFTAKPFNPYPYADWDGTYIGYMTKSIDVKNCIFKGDIDTIFFHISCAINNLNSIDLSGVTSYSITLLDNYSGPDVDLYSSPFHGFDGSAASSIKIVSLESGCTSNIDIRLGDSSNALAEVHHLTFTDCRKIYLDGNLNGLIFGNPNSIFVPTCTYMYVGGNYSKKTGSFLTIIGWTSPPTTNTTSEIYLNDQPFICETPLYIYCDCFSSITLTKLLAGSVCLKCVDPTRDKLTSITWFTTIGSAAYIGLSNITEANMKEFFTGLVTVTTTANINIIAATYARLSTADIAIATNKGYTVTKEA